GANLVGTTTAADDGSWSITTSSLSEGDHSLTVTATDAAGNTSDLYSTLSLTIDSGARTAPAAPTLDAASNSGSTADTITNDSTPATSSTTLSLHDALPIYGANLVGTTTAADDGSWSITTSSLSEGDHSLTVTATD